MLNKKDKSSLDYGSMHDLNVVLFSVVAIIGIISIVIFILLLSQGISLSKSTKNSAGNAYSVLDQKNDIILNKDGTIHIMTPEGKIIADCYCPKTKCPDCRIRIITSG
ncbi:MAG: hypothetical protein QXG00_00660 [Candidatus Woesearchaeota archaeon]